MNKNRIAIMVNASAGVRVSKRNIFGTEHIVIEGAGSIIGDSVMNGLLYPLDEIKKLAGDETGIIHAPASHPVDAAGNFISASSPEGVHQGYFGAISYNYRMVGDRLVRDIAIDPVIANTTEQGREVLRRIENGEDIDTSTGLLLYIEEVDGIGKDGEPYQGIAHNMMLDHDAVLLNERGAATTLQGVGFFANSEGKKEEIDVATIEANASMPAMRLPLAPTDYTFNEDEAVQRLREYTNSTTEPSSNYRRFFLSFNRADVSNFESYKYPFADVINGVPHAVLSAIENAEKLCSGSKSVKNSKTESNSDFGDDDTATILAISKAYKGKFGVNKEKGSHNVLNGIKSALQNLFNLIDNSGNTLYTANESEELNINSTEGERNMRDFITNKLKALGINTDGLSDDELQAKFNEAFTTETKEKEVKVEDNSDAIANAIAKAVEPLTSKINSLESKLEAENNALTDSLVAQVTSLNVGIDEDTAKEMSVNSLKKVIEANKGSVNFNVNTGGFEQSESVSYSIPE